jgi:hypothetical protein
MNTYHDLERLEARLRRLETRLCKLMIHMGMDPQTNEPLEEPPMQQPKDHVPTSKDWSFISHMLRKQ